MQYRTLRVPVALTTAAATALACSSAFGQTLRERADAVRAKQKERENALAARAQEMRLGPKSKILQKLLYTKLTVNFDETHARDAINFLKTALDIPIIARYSDDALGFGIDPEAPVTLEAEETTALDVLEMVLEQCSVTEECTWQLRRSFLEVGTKERLSVAGAQELKVYPIDDLVTDPPDFTGAPSLLLEDTLASGYFPGAYGSPYGYGFYRGYFGGYYPYGGMRGYGGSIRANDALQQTDSEDERRENAAELIDLITTMIEPQMWERNGGTGAAIEYREGALVVRAPDFIHRQIWGYPRVPHPEPAPQTPDEDEETGTTDGH